jgi:hypothetical protein
MYKARPMNDSRAFIVSAGESPDYRRGNHQSFGQRIAIVSVSEPSMYRVENRQEIGRRTAIVSPRQTVRRIKRAK